MSATPNLQLPYILAAQAQKHVTHNEAIRALDAVIQIGVIDRDLTSPPASPDEGDRYIVPVAATGAWAGKDGYLAAWQDGVWMFYTPAEGWLAWVRDEDVLYAWDGSAWARTGGSEFEAVGINATADAIDRLTVKSDAVLFSHDDVTPGSGSVRHKLNKAAAGDTASVLFQSGFSGRAEFGLAGSDDWQVKVSGDGVAWNAALIADRTTGAVRFPGGMEHSVSRAPVSGLIFTPGGDGVVSIYRNDVSSGQNPRSATIASIDGDTIALTAAVAASIFDNARMAGVSYARIWNVSKATPEPAWIVAQPAADRLRVLDNASISGWASGETIQLGDPVTATPGRVFALDISPMMQALLGAVFQQKGIVVKSGMRSQTVGDDISVSPSGEGGSFATAARSYLADPGFNGDGVTIVPCTELSAVSDSNLVFVRETIASTGTIRLLSAMAVLG